MQFSESWLRSLVSPSLDSEALAHLLTMAGLEVEESRSVAPDFDKVVVARVLGTEKHPDADRLKICRVDAGQGEPLQIVCGAPNVTPGMVVPCALVGAKLPGIEIRRAKVRGVESFGMLCSAQELGIAEVADGLMSLPADAQAGTSVRELLDLDDRLLTLKLTPNRADCLSLLGIAREVAALTGAPLHEPEMVEAIATLADQRSIVLDAPAACPRYCGRVLRGVDAARPTPEWLRRRIEHCGIRSISAIVDVTNYVMLELGQPLHAFDDAKLDGTVHVRYPRPGESLRLLNGQLIEPDAETLLIADDARALALAGIMGGEDSGVTTATQDVFLESAFFAPEAVAGKARAFGFGSDASHRFERGVDFNLPQRAIQRATQLILDICGGAAGPVVEAIAPQHLPARTPVCLRAGRAGRILGMELASDRIEDMFRRLGFACTRNAGDLIVTPPSHRFDIEIEEDLVEEVARMHGYDNIPSRPPRGRIAMMPATELRRGAMDLRERLAERDYREVVNYSFVDAAWERDFCGNAAPIVLANPIASQMGVMRSSLMGGLVANLSTNLKRQIDRVRVFEIGRCFFRSEAGSPVPGYEQPLRLAGLCAGPAAPEQWGLVSRGVDFFDAKSDLLSLFPGAEPAFGRHSHPALHPGRTAAIRLGDRQIGVIGELHPRWVQQYDLGKAPVLFELDLDCLLERPLAAYREVSRFPAVVRDLALIVPREIELQHLLDALRAAAPAIVLRIELFDLYQGKGIAEDRKSLAFRIVMQDTQRTLEDAEVENAVAGLIESAVAGFGAELRR